MNQKLAADIFGKSHRLRKPQNVGVIKNTVIVNLFGAVIIDDANLAQLFRFLQEFGYFIGVINVKSHFKQLIIRSVFLRADIGYIEIEVIYQNQNSRAKRTSQGEADITCP